MAKAFFGVTLRRNDSIFNGTFFEGCPFKFRLMETKTYHKSVKQDGAIYTPFKIKWEYYDYYYNYQRLDNLALLSHDVMHALDYFIKDTKERLLKSNFGLGQVKSSFTYNE